MRAPYAVAPLCFAATLVGACNSASSPPKLSERCHGDTNGQRTCDLYFRGQIEAGDARAIERRILASTGIVARITFDSLGGAAFEGIKIGRILNKYFVSMEAPRCHQLQEEPICFEENNAVQGRRAVCASACALAMLVVDQRAVRANAVLLHRPNFPESMFSGLSATEARDRYESASAELMQSLRAHGVSDEIVTAIMSTPSEQARALQAYPPHSPWLEEWLRARCGASLSDIESDKLGALSARFLAPALTGPLTTQEQTEFDALSVRDRRHSGCVWRALTAARKRAQQK